MRVAGLDKSNDWRFGRGIASYVKDAEAIRQNVSTRLKSFKRDDFLNVDTNIDWVTLLGARNTKDLIKREVERVTLSTDGVLKINTLTIDVSVSTRTATIELNYSDIFSEGNELVLGVTA